MAQSDSVASWLVGLLRVTQTLNVGTAVGTNVGDINASGGLNLGTATGASAGQIKASGGLDLAGSKFVVNASGSLTKVNNVALGNWPANAAGYFKNNGSGTLSWATVQHSELGGVTADQHHAQAHTLTSHSSRAHSELTGIGADDHHAQSHTHASHMGIGANDHHAQLHAATHRPGGGDALAGYTYVPLTTAATAWADGSRVLGTYLIDTSAAGLPAGVKAVYIWMSAWWSTANDGYMLYATCPTTGSIATLCRAFVGSHRIDTTGIVPCDGNGDFNLVLAGAGSSYCYCYIMGYFI